jgi:hypothetical protein
MTTLNERDLSEAFEQVPYEVPVSRVIAAARRRQHRRRMAVGALPAAGLLAAGGYVVTHREVKERGTLGCSSQFDQLGDITIIGRVEGETPTETCIKVMTNDAEWTPRPLNPVECVTNYPNGDGGALVVFPAPEGLSQEEACQQIGAALPTDDPS